VQVKSAIGREFSLATNQVDFAQSERFDLTFVNEQGQVERPVIIHRAPLSTHERLIGFLLEHYAGAFPVWLAPEQVRIIPITDEQAPAAQELYDLLHASGVRAELDLDAERMNAKIRKAQVMKVPYMAVLGKREAAEKSVALRKRDGSQAVMDVNAFVKLVQDKAKSRDAEL
jgi:threonyl-tRNA synthetase